MKRVLRLQALVMATVYGMSFLLHVCSYPKEDVPAEIWAEQFSSAPVLFISTWISTWRGVRVQFRNSPAIESRRA
jgi:uncharacterized protein YcbX